MCMIEDADGYNEWSGESSHVARKTHKCGECHRQIEPGERYYVMKWKYDGQFDTSNICAHCRVAGTWLEENCSGFLVCMIEDDIAEHVTEYRGRSKCVARLKRLKVGMERHWKIKRGPRAGQLMPLPQLPSKLEPNLAHY